jgi:hypothetical protein
MALPKTRGVKPRAAPSKLTDLAKFGRVGSSKLVFDSGLVSIDDPGIMAVHEGYDDLVKAFDRPALIY